MKKLKQKIDRILDQKREKLVKTRLDIDTVMFLVEMIRSDSKDKKDFKKNLWRFAKAGMEHSTLLSAILEEIENDHDIN